MGYILGSNIINSLRLLKWVHRRTILHVFDLKNLLGTCDGNSTYTKRSRMMATAAVIGLSAGKRLLSSSSYYSDLTEKLPYVNDHALANYQITSTKKVISAKKSSNFSPSFTSSDRQTQSIKAVKEHVDITSSPSTAEPWIQRPKDLEEESSDLDYSVEALLLLQKSMLEKQWTLSFEGTVLTDSPRGRILKKLPVTCSGVSARQRRMTTRKKLLNKNGNMMQPCISKQLRSMISPGLLQNRSKGYLKGVISEDLLSHADVVCLSKKIKTGLSLEEQKLRWLHLLSIWWIILIWWTVSMQPLLTFYL